MLVSGRWFCASGASGPWEFVPANALPKDFRDIPDASPKENAKAAVAGTPQAEEAAIAASIPQTSTVKKSAVKMTPPILDGEPELRAVSGTPLQYVVNTVTPVVTVDPHTWYAVEHGVWFVSGSVKGPWVVAALDDGRRPAPASLSPGPEAGPVR